MLIIKSFITDNNNISTVVVDEYDRITTLVVELKTKGFLDNLYDIQKTTGDKYSLGSSYDNYKWIIKVTDNDERRTYEYTHRMVFSTSILKY